MTTRIYNIDGVLCVDSDGCLYRRKDGVWEMKGRNGEWFANKPQYDTARVIADYENCLRPYTFEESVKNLERKKKAQKDIKISSLRFR